MAHACNIAVTTTLRMCAAEKLRAKARTQEKHINLQHHAYSLEWVLSVIDETLLTDR